MVSPAELVELQDSIHDAWSRKEITTDERNMALQAVEHWDLPRPQLITIPVSLYKAMQQEIHDLRGVISLTKGSIELYRRSPEDPDIVLTNIGRRLEVQSMKDYRPK